jgi:hypothetical protein
MLLATPYRWRPTREKAALSEPFKIQQSMENQAFGPFWRFRFSVSI